MLGLFREASYFVMDLLVGLLKQPMDGVIGCRHVEFLGFITSPFISSISD